MKPIYLSTIAILLSVTLVAQSDTSPTLVGNWELTRVENLDLQNRSFSEPNWMGAYFFFSEDGLLTIENKGHLFFTKYEQEGATLTYEEHSFTIDRQFAEYWTYLFVDERAGLNCRLHFVPTEREKRPVTQDQRSVNRNHFPLLLNESQLPRESPETYKVAEEMPRFPGCEDEEATEPEKKQCAQQELLKFIYRNLQYPQEARDARTEGTVVISFLVQTDGSTSDARVVRSIGDGCDEEAKRVVELMAEQGLIWTPGKQRGEAVRVQFNLPIKFKLE